MTILVNLTIPNVLSLGRNPGHNPNYIYNSSAKPYKITNFKIIQTDSTHVILLTNQEPIVMSMNTNFSKISET
jgi:hypothetical protein